MKNKNKTDKVGARLAVDVPKVYIKLLDGLTKEYVSRSDVVRKYIMNGLIGDGKLTVSGEVVVKPVYPAPMLADCNCDLPGGAGLQGATDCAEALATATGEPATGHCGCVCHQR